ncbi:MAG TPA: hypothetical protein VES73_17905 [Lamprocystis sp. (in: g-proteobacteria)]|nr:hypothetical protein [Lamprocystis sp. (in: g-proteobacteria)]
MTAFAVATEDALSEAVAETLLQQVGGHVVHQRLRRGGFGYLKQRITAFNHPKAALLDLVRKSKHRELRQEILPRPGVSFPVGLGYNDQWCRFVRDHWETGRAAKASPSLARAVERLTSFSE